LLVRDGIGQAAFDPLTGAEGLGVRASSLENRPNMSSEDEARRRMRDLGKKLIPDDEFNALLREETGQIGKVFAGLRDEMGPVLVVILRQREKDGSRQRGLVELSSFPAGDEKRKVLFSAGMRTAGASKDVVAALLSTEAWLKTMSPAEQWRSKGSVLQAPGKAPDRQEAVVITASTLDGRIGMAMAPTERGGGTRRLGRWKVVEWKGWGKAASEDNLLKYFFAGYLLGMKERGKER
jgi:hypothetical protein